MSLVEHKELISICNSHYAMYTADGLYHRRSSQSRKSLPRICPAAISIWQSIIYECKTPVEPGTRLFVSFDRGTFFRANLTRSMRIVYARRRFLDHTQAGVVCASAINDSSRIIYRPLIRDCDKSERYKIIEQSVSICAAQASASSSSCSSSVACAEHNTRRF